MAATRSGARYRRSSRIAALVRTLTARPGFTFPLTPFMQQFNVARSTLSEDLSIIKDSLTSFDLGRVETRTGAGGGVRYLPCRSAAGIREAVHDLCSELSDPGRILAGGYLYTTDVIFSPVWSATLGEVFASLLQEVMPETGADAVVTVETKGIPVALMTARALNLPLVIIRRDARVTEGSAVSINYFSGSTGNIQTMSLPRRALARGARVVLVDDFMRAGGTARGVGDLMAEFEATVLATAVVTETRLPAEKLVDRYISLTVLEQATAAERQVSLFPSPAVLKML